MPGQKTQAPNHSFHSSLIFWPMAVIVGTGSIKKLPLEQSGNIMAPCAICKQWLERSGMQKNTSQTLTFLHCHSECLAGLASKKKYKKYIWDLGEVGKTYIAAEDGIMGGNEEICLWSYASATLEVQSHFIYLACNLKQNILLFKTQCLHPQNRKTIVTVSLECDGTKILKKSLLKYVFVK